MKVFALGLLVAAAGVVNQPTFRSSVDIVRVTATVTADGGGYVRDLAADDFVLEDQGREQPIVLFASERQAVSIIFLVDISVSMRGAAYDQARKSIDVFARQHMGADDEVYLCVFSSATTCANRWSRDPDALAWALRRISPRGSTRLLDALEPAMSQFVNARHPKQVLVMLTDGNDLDSRRSPGEARQMLRASDVLVYAIGFPSSDAGATLPEMVRRRPLVDLGLLRSLTDASGGRTFRVSSSADIVGAVTALAEELGHQYLLGYVTPNPKQEGYREIRVRVKDAAYSVRARTGYVARAASE